MLLCSSYCSVSNAARPKDM